MKKQRNISKEIEVIKKNQMEIIELKNTITEIFLNSRVSNSRMEKKEDRTGEQKDRSINLTQSEQQRADRLQKTSTKAQTPGVNNKRLNIRPSQKVRRKTVVLKEYLRK